MNKEDNGAKLLPDVSEEVPDIWLTLCIALVDEADENAEKSSIAWAEEADDPTNI